MSTKDKTAETPKGDDAQANEQRALANENKALRGQVKELTEQLKVKEATAGSKLPSVKVGNAHYQVTGPKLSIKGKTLLAADVVKDAALCEQLVAKRSGYLKQVNIK